MTPVRLALVLAAAFGAWEILFAGFMADDLMQLAVLEGVSPAAAWTGPFHLYTRRVQAPPVGGEIVIPFGATVRALVSAGDRGGAAR